MCIVCCSAFRGNNILFVVYQYNVLQESSTRGSIYSKIQRLPRLLLLILFIKKLIRHFQDPGTKNSLPFLNTKEEILWVKSTKTPARMLQITLDCWFISKAGKEPNERYRRYGRNGRNRGPAANLWTKKRNNAIGS